MLLALTSPALKGIILLEDKYQLPKQPLKYLLTTFLCLEISQERSEQEAEISNTMKTSSKEPMHPYVHSSTIHNSQVLETA